MDEKSEEDPVIAEVDVYHTTALADNLHMLQYPLRPAHLPYHAIMGAKVSPQGGVSLDVSVRPRGENYSTSRGEGYAKMVHLGVKGQDKVYPSGLWDKLTLTADKPTERPSRYVAAVFKDGDLHLTSVSQILQLKPSVGYLDQAESGAKVSRAAAMGSDGDTTESEGEEAVPVTVRFARHNKGQGSRPRKKGYSESVAREWLDARYEGVQSEEATEERRLLFASEESGVTFDLPRGDYLNVVCPMDTPLSTVEPAAMPTGVLSLSHLKMLPLDQQVCKVLLNAHVVQFTQLCSLLGVTSQLGGVMAAVQGCAVLVQGCWVVNSQLLYPEDKTKRNARDYILWCFTQRPLVPRKEVLGAVKLPAEELREMLSPLSYVRVTPISGWEFKVTDVEFINKQTAVVHEQERRWTERHKELVKELGLKTPAAAKHTEGKVVAGDVLVRNAQKQSAERLAAAVRAEPMEVDNDDLRTAIQEFCRDSLGRGVLGLTELKDKLLLKQSSVELSHPLRACGVSDALLVEGVRGCGAVEVCTSGRSLYALTHGDKVREVILSLLQSHKFIKKKQLIECLAEEDTSVPDKVLTGTLRELCYSKGSQWKLLGTD